MGYKLRAGMPPLRVMGGEFAGHTFQHGVVYEHVPPEYAAAFQDINAVKRPKKKAEKKEDEQ